MKNAHAPKRGTEKMAGPAIDKTKPDDKNVVDHFTSCQPACRSEIHDMELAYLHWFSSYVSRPASHLGTYVGANGKLRVCSHAGNLKPKQSERRGVLGTIRNGLKNFGFFPNTPVEDCYIFQDEADALLNDWAIVGADLYDAIRQYRIDNVGDAPQPTDPDAVAQR